MRKIKQYFLVLDSAGHVISLRWAPVPWDIIGCGYEFVEIRNTFPAYKVVNCYI
jgi:hypothetical protein